MNSTVTTLGTHRQGRLIDTAAVWLANGQSIWLCTLLSGRDASVDKPGSMLIARPDGRCAGSLCDGGIDEDMLIRLVCGDISGRVERVRYCDRHSGDTREILVERLAPSDRLFDHLRGMRESLTGRGPTRREVRLSDGRFELIPDRQPDCPVMLAGAPGGETASIRIAPATL